MIGGRCSVIESLGRYVFSDIVLERAVFCERGPREVCV